MNSETPHEAPYKVGDKVDVWFPGGEILAVRKYDGAYKQWFKYILRVTAPRTKAGWMELAV